MAAVFGITYQVKKGSTGTVWVLVDSLELNARININVSKDASGDVDAYQYSGREVDMSCIVTYEINEVGQISTGNILNVNNRDYLIDSVKIMQSNDGYTKAQVTGKRWLGNSIPVAVVA